MTIREQLLELTHSLLASQILRAHRLLLSAFVLSSFLTPVEALEERPVLLPCSLLNPALSKSYWHPLDHNIHIKSVSLIVPGLNLNHRKLNSLASALIQAGVAPLIVPLEDPSPESLGSDIAWQAQVQLAYCKARKWARERNISHVHAIGHSLGALALLDLLTREHGERAQTLTLIAPSLYVRTMTKLIDWIDWLPFGSLPSFNLEDYRLNDSTKLSTYHSLRIMREHSLAHESEIKNWPATLIIMSPKDELIDSELTKEFASEHKLSFKYLTPHSEGQRTIQHLIIDPPSMGQAEFEKFVRLIEKHFAQD